MPELLRTATFRLTLGSAALLAGVTLLEFSLIYWRTTAYEVARADRLLDREAAVMAALPPLDLEAQLRLWQTNDLRLLVTAAGLFQADGTPVFGNLRVWPRALRPGAGIRDIRVHPLDQGVRAIRAEAVTVAGGRVLVIGRSLRDLQQIRSIVLDAIETALIPALLASLLAGAWLGRRNLARVGRMQLAIDRIMQGGLHERLPVRRTDWPDEIERLASSMNRMLDRLEQLLDEIKGVGDDIAHDLRTPLARVKAGLERARLRSQGGDALPAAIDRALLDLDQCFGVITALLRIGEIGSGRRRGAFAPLELRQIVDDIVELYEPVAEAAGNRLLVVPGPPGAVSGDRDLLIELAANLVDNAIKFTPEGGEVELSVVMQEACPVLRAADSGIGIAPEERHAVLGRFYRSDKSRHIAGSGLGLSLVDAIARLHGAAVGIMANPASSTGTGTVIEIRFPPAAAPFPASMLHSLTVGHDPSRSVLSTDALAKTRRQPGPPGRRSMSQTVFARPARLAAALLAAAAISGCTYYPGGYGPYGYGYDARYLPGYYGYGGYNAYAGYPYGYGGYWSGWGWGPAWGLGYGYGFGGFYGRGFYGGYGGYGRGGYGRGGGFGGGHGGGGGHGR